MRYESYDGNGDKIRNHRTARAAYDEAVRPKNMGWAVQVDEAGSRKTIHEGTTADIVRGKLDITRVISSNNHRLLPDGSVATKCVDGHEEITRKSEDGRINSWYNVLYV